jgi:hypothetical protein
MLFISFFPCVVLSFPVQAKGSYIDDTTQKETPPVRRLIQNFSSRTQRQRPCRAPHQDF